MRAGGRGARNPTARGVKTKVHAKTARVKKERIMLGTVRVDIGTVDARVALRYTVRVRYAHLLIQCGPQAVAVAHMRASLRREHSRDAPSTLLPNPDQASGPAPPSPSTRITCT